MARKSMGAHGSINTWKDERRGLHQRITIRPEPRIFTAEDVAGILAYRYEFIPDPDPYDYDKKEPTYQETWQKIMEENPSKKEIMRIISDIWYIANHEQWTDSSIHIDTDLESHQAMVDFVYMRFPKLKPQY